ncbi:amidohydrolase family protein [Baekduia sp. Peel2402]|uniref:amidohydrolase family protein n=1 Tax=Baekduia sp. Peel2402 TaxID=3458296 RepID=UPI00403EBF07
MTEALLVKNAAVVWTGERTLHDADVLVTDGRVAAVGPSLDGPGEAVVIDARGCLVAPGLVNAHHHLLQSAFRTLPGTRGVPMREWLAVMNGAYMSIGIDPELCGAAAAVGLAESLLNGVTTVADHHLTWPADADHLGMAEAVVLSARSLGARLVFVRGTAGDDAETAAASADALAGFVGGAVAPDGMVGLAVGPAGVHSDGRATFEALREVALHHGLVRRTQANEQVDVIAAEERYGRRPLELLRDWGWLEPGVTIAHLCEVTDEEIALVAACGVTATHAPGCDLPMGWGLAPAGALLDAGVVVGLGTSGGGSNDAGHLLADARLALQASPLSGRPLTTLEALTMATRGSATGLARPELGHLEPGAAADLNVYDLTGVADAGVADPVAGLLWASPGRRPRHVAVAGRVVVRDGALTGTDERALAERLTALLATRRGAVA